MSSNLIETTGIYKGMRILCFEQFILEKFAVTKEAPMGLDPLLGRKLLAKKLMDINDSMPDINDGGCGFCGDAL